MLDSTPPKARSLFKSKHLCSLDRHASLYRWLFALLLICGGQSLCFAQTNQPLTPTPISALPGNVRENARVHPRFLPHKISWSLAKIGYKQDIFAEYTGERIYKKVDNPRYFTSFLYEYFPALRVPLISAFSLGVDYNYIDYQAREFAESVSLTHKPLIDMTKHMSSASVRAYMELTNSVYINIGLGLGYILGQFTGSVVTDTRSRRSYAASFSGAYSYREFGVIIVNGAFSGGVFFRLTDAPEVTFDDDHFNTISKDGKKNMDFDATVSGIYLSYGFH